MIVAQPYDEKQTGQKRLPGAERIMHTEKGCVVILGKVVAGTAVLVALDAVVVAIGAVVAGTAVGAVA